MSDYDSMVESLTETWNEFVANAQEGKEGRGSKTKALAARKASMKLSNDLKDFRSASIANDREK